MATANNSLNINSNGFIAYNNSTGVFSSTSMTQYNLLTGGSNAQSINQIAPGSTSGVPLISQGASAYPIYGTAVVAGGGTGNTSATAYSVLCGGTTSTGALQSVSGVGTSGQVLTSNGASALPTWQNASGGSGFTSMSQQVFTSSGTYTPTSGMLYCNIECVGGGGGGGGSGACTTGNFAIGGSGGGGQYARAVFTAATIGSSQTVTVGAAGAAGTAGANAGGAGGTTSVGSLISAGGGSGGAAGTATTGGVTTAGAAGGTGGSISSNVGTGLLITGGKGGYGAIYGPTGFSFGSEGGRSYFGPGAPAYTINNSTGTASSGSAAPANSGGGGNGSFQSAPANTATAGSAGGTGLVVITEYI